MRGVLIPAWNFFEQLVERGFAQVFKEFAVLSAVIGGAQVRMDREPPHKRKILRFGRRLNVNAEKRKWLPPVVLEQSLGDGDEAQILSHQIALQK